MAKIWRKIINFVSNLKDIIIENMKNRAYGKAMDYAFEVTKTLKGGMRKSVLLVLTVLISLPMEAQSPKYSASMIKSHGEEWSAGKAWDYVSGLVAKTILMYCSQYPEDDLSAEAYAWCKTYADNAIDADGKFYNFKKGSLDNIASGKVLFDLDARESVADPAAANRYRVAADYLYNY